MAFLGTTKIGVPSRATEMGVSRSFLAIPRIRTGGEDHLESAMTDTRLTPEDLISQFDWLRGLARRLVDDPDVAEDLVQDTYVVALAHQPRDRSRLRGWLGGVLRNTARDRWRRDKVRHKHEQELAASQSGHQNDENSAALAEQVAMQRELVDAVLALHEPYRETLLLRYFGEKKPKQIAKQLDVSIATVNSRVSRGLGLLRERLDRTQGGDRQKWKLALVPLFAKLSPPPLFLPEILLVHTSIKIIAGVAVALACASGLYWVNSSKTDAETLTESSLESHQTQLESRVAPSRSAGGSKPSPFRRDRLARPTKTNAKATKTARGLVLDPNSNPVPGVRVAFESTPEQSVRSDLAGRFELAVPKAKRLLLVTTEPEYTTVLSAAYKPNARIEPVLVVARKIAHGGLVVNAHGKPIAGGSPGSRVARGVSYQDSALPGSQPHDGLGPRVRRRRQILHRQRASDRGRVARSKAKAIRATEGQKCSKARTATSTSCCVSQTPSRKRPSSDVSSTPLGPA